VTGASRGIGRATVAAFLDAGWRVVAGCRDPRAANLPSLDDALLVVRMDVTDVESVRSAAQAAEVHGRGRIDCLVNNAGHAVMGAIEDVELDVVREAFETNLYGPIGAIQAVLPGMRRAGVGTIINVSSVAGRITHPLLGIYDSSKYALTSVSEALAMECRPHGVRVVLIEPGMVDTRFGASGRISGSVAASGGPYGALREGVVAAFRRWREWVNSSPEAVAAAIVGAAGDPAAPFRVVVGEDAELLLRERAARDDDDFQRYVARDFLGLDW
jgi:NAD(P)-dependent dehydrogenase (short-subunit alcohol dehydrogenase family)